MQKTAHVLVLLVAYFIWQKIGGILGLIVAAVVSGVIEMVFMVGLGAGGRSARAILLYAVAVIVFGALFAPVLFWLVQIVGEITHSQWLLSQPFRRVLNRAVLLVAFVGLWPLLRALGFRSWSEIGFVRAPRWGRQVWLGIALGLASLFVAGSISLALGARVLDLSRTTSEVSGKLLGFLATAVVVALLEETFFRGGLLGALRRSISLSVALPVASAVYSALHFLKPTSFDIAVADVRWYTGWECLRVVLTGSLATPGVAVGFVTLFLAGCILGWALAKTGALYLSIGLHAGWVFMLKTYALLTAAGSGSVARWLGAGAIIENVITWPVMLLLFWVVSRICLEPAK